MRESNTPLWDNEIFTARWRASIRIIYCELLKEKVQSENLTEDPYFVERIKQAEADAVAATEKIQSDSMSKKNSIQQRGGKVK